MPPTPSDTPLHRLEACKRLGWKKIPAFVKHISSEDVFLTGLIENLQRNIRINPVAEARGYKRLMAKGWTSHEIAESIGKSDSYVYDRLRVLDRLHPSIQRELITHVCNSPIISWSCTLLGGLLGGVRIA
jgi:ParB/RepB/Spo0J family partition protein